MTLALTLVVATCLAPLGFCIMNDNYHPDSYMSAYMEFKGSTDVPPGVVYPESIHSFGPPIPYGPPAPPRLPTHYYGPPTPVLGPLAELYHTYAPVIELLSHIPQKLEFLPKVIAGFLTITKILLKVVLLKLILKLIVMFCMFFFFPKLDMLDAASEMIGSSAPSAISPADTNFTLDAAPANDEDEARLNRMTSFVLNSAQNRTFMNFCDDDKRSSLQCKVTRMLQDFEQYATFPRLINMVSFSPKGSTMR